MKLIPSLKLVRQGRNDPPVSNRSKALRRNIFAFSPLCNSLRAAALAALAIAAVTGISAYSPAKAVTFDEREVDQNRFIVLAVPYGKNNYNLLVLEQIPGQRQCWSESGSNPAIVEPLLLNFDFTGICERSTDSNGYSIRIDGQDYGLDYLLSIVERNGELELIGVPRKDPNKPEIFVGRSYGLGKGFIKMLLNPGWRLTRRAYAGTVLAHVYFSGNSTAMNPTGTPAQSIPEPPLAENPPAPASSEARELVFSAFGDNNTQPLPPAQIAKAPAPPGPSLPLPQPPSPGAAREVALPEAANSQPLPPPPTPSTATGGRKGLSDLLVVAPRPLPNRNGTSTPNPTLLPPPPLPSPDLGNSGRTAPMARTGQGERYRVMVEARTNSQQAQVRSLYPEAFPTTYQRQSMLQVGVFNSRDNAEFALQTLKNMGLNGIIVQF